MPLFSFIYKQLLLRLFLSFYFIKILCVTYFCLCYWLWSRFAFGTAPTIRTRGLFWLAGWKSQNSGGGARTTVAGPIVATESLSSESASRGGGSWASDTALIWLCMAFARWAASWAACLRVRELCRWKPIDGGLGLRSSSSERCSLLSCCVSSSFLGVVTVDLWAWIWQRVCWYLCCCCCCCNVGVVMWWVLAGRIGTCCCKIKLFSNDCFRNRRQKILPVESFWRRCCWWFALWQVSYWIVRVLSLVVHWCHCWWLY